MSDFVRLPQIARTYGLAYQTLWNVLLTGVVPCERDGRGYRVAPSDVSTLVAAAVSKPTRTPRLPARVAA
jgi:hypothetical protein